LSKYRAKKDTRMLGKELYEFDSKLEASQFDILVIQLKNNEIEELIVQPRFELLPTCTVKTNATKSGKSKQSPITYVSDFSYLKDGKKIVVDVKGISLPVFNLKKKMFLQKLNEFGIDEFHLVFRDKTIKYIATKEATK